MNDVLVPAKKQAQQFVTGLQSQVNIQVKPLVSVIIPVYQGEAMIVDAVKSALNQTFTSLEVIVVNDGSTDNTLAVLSSVQDSRLRVIEQSNQGVAAARNLGVAESLGDYLAFLDADDRWSPDKLAAELSVLKKQSDEVAIVYSWYYGVDDDNRLINQSPKFKNSGNLYQVLLENESVMLPSTTLMHRQVFERIGGFQQSCYHEDRAFFIRACREFPAYPTQQRLVYYRQSMDGRCRKVLKDFDKACAAEYSIVTALADILTNAETQALTKMQTRSLMYRFMMYGFMDASKRMFKTLCKHQSMTSSFNGYQTLLKDKKGMLVLLSFITGINLLSPCRVLVQGINKTLITPFWNLRQSALGQKATRFKSPQVILEIKTSANETLSTSNISDHGQILTGASLSC